MPHLNPASGEQTSRGLNEKNDTELSVVVLADGGRSRRNRIGGGSDPCMGKTGSDPQRRGFVPEPLYRCHRLGGSDWAELQQTRVRILGRRAGFPRSRAGNGAWNLDLEERLQLGGRGPRR